MHVSISAGFIEGSLQLHMLWTGRYAWNNRWHGNIHCKARW